jgi:hypothetical protein
VEDSVKKTRGPEKLWRKIKEFPDSTLDERKMLDVSESGQPVGKWRVCRTNVGLDGKKVFFVCSAGKNCRAERRTLYSSTD